MKKILIANRGEIARRVIKSALSMGIKTVAVYSDPDTQSLYVQEADESYRLPGITSRETYLQSEKILSIAKKTGCDAIHPGYGFLSENAEFAQLCLDSNINFIGPSPEAIDHLGSKTNARLLAIENDVPVLPGTTRGVNSFKEAIEIANNINFPILLKAAAGGGGKGMRVVENEDELEVSLKMAQSESLSSFGSDEVFIERYITEPRHIELQVIADKLGNVLILGERECSIQRRHQKVIEEAPSVILTPDTRAKMIECAQRLIKGANYYNAGTLEFLLDTDGSFYFLEVNTRLQVEHPVSEMVTGIDLVKEQLLVAMGEEISVKQKDLIINGHAIECRICAEDVYQNFMPSIGLIRDLIEPVGENIRVDSSLYKGLDVTPYYDPMLAKLICWGENRETAIELSKKALNDFHIAGIKTTIPFCKYVLNHEDFVSGNFSTNFVKKNWLNVEQDIDMNSMLKISQAAIISYNKSIL
ncbi:MAG: acetyl-CoA carboxylase biotin carboxylase subunit [Chlorobiota bacterium]|nr:MAG: acetyl-CoA carboxylase biotin carboxylase subunit [Chlorobiota bacterium]